MMLRFEPIYRFEDNQLKDKWNELLALSSSPIIFQRYEWVSSCWKYFSKPGEGLFVFLVYDCEELIGIIPLKGKSRRNKYYDFSLIGADVYDYSDLLIKKGKEKDIVDGLLNHLREQHRNFTISFKNIPQDCDSSRYLSKKMSEGDIKGYIYSEDCVPYLVLPESKEGFLPEITKRLRADIMRQVNRLSSQGELRLESCDNLEEALKMSDVFFAQHIKRWESSNGYSVYKFKTKKEFLRVLLKGLFAPKIANMFTLFLGPRPIATCFALAFKGRFIYLSPTYDIEYAKYSPGKILLYKLINRCIEEGYEIFDFGIGCEAYKMQWPCNIFKLHSFFIFSGNGGITEFLSKLKIRFSMFYSFKCMPVLRRCKIIVYLWRLYKRKQPSFNKS